MLNLDLILIFQDATTRTTYKFTPKARIRSIDVARIFQLFYATSSMAPPKDGVDEFIEQNKLSSHFTITTAPL